MHISIPRRSRITYNLELDGLAVELDSTDFLYRISSQLESGKIIIHSPKKSNTYKINTDGGDVRLSVCVVSETQQQARFTDTGVTDEQELEEIIATK